MRKYYFPTTTLNFSCIISMEKILPIEFYTQKSYFWWNKFYESGMKQNEGRVTLYPCPVWPTLPSYAGANYPMLVEVEIDQQDKGDNPILLYWLTLKPKSTRFLFRSSDELADTLLKASITAENKAVKAYERNGCFQVLDNEARTVLSDGLPFDGVELPMDSLKDSKDYWAKYIEAERRDGANLGWLVGSSIKSLLRFRYLKEKTATLEELMFCEDESLKREIAGMLTAFDGFSFNGRSGLSRPETASLEGKLIDFFVSKIEGNATGNGIVNDPKCDYVVKVWQNVVKPHYEESNRRESVRKVYNKFLANRQDPQKDFSLAEMNEFPEVQAVAALFLVGFDHNRLVDVVSNGNLTKTELLISMYGAVLGYTIFPRMLMDRGMYLKRKNVVKPLPKAVSVTYPEELVKICEQFGLKIKRKSKLTDEFFEEVYENLKMTVPYRIDEHSVREVLRRCLAAKSGEKKKGKVKWLEDLKKNIEEDLPPLGETVAAPSARIGSPSESRDMKRDIKSIEDLPENVKERLRDIWKYTKWNKTLGYEEHIRHFIDLCKKEGRGKLENQTSLKGVFTEELADRMERKLLEKYSRRQIKTEGNCRDVKEVQR